MPTVRYIDLNHPDPRAIAAIDALNSLSGKPKGPSLAIKVRKSRKEVLAHIEDYEEGRQALLDLHAEKDEDGERKTVPVLHDGEPVTGPNGPVENVVIADPDAYATELSDLLKTEVECRFGFVPTDFEGQPDGFTLEAELEALGPLLVDDDDELAQKRAEKETA